MLLRKNGISDYFICEIISRLSFEFIFMCTNKHPQAFLLSNIIGGSDIDEERME